MTLLDGEMVIDVVPETQQRTRRYLIYDIMMLNQESLVQVYVILCTTSLYSSICMQIFRDSSLT
jgi:hypothetical protein